MSYQQQKPTGFVRIIKATKHSISGLKSAFMSEAAVRQELAAMLLLIPLAIWLPVPITHKWMLIFSTILVLVVELLNTAIESVVDRVGYDYHELSGKAKDIGSAAVFICLWFVAGTWATVLYVNVI